MWTHSFSTSPWGLEYCHMLNYSHLHSWRRVKQYAAAWHQRALLQSCLTAWHDRAEAKIFTEVRIGIASDHRCGGGVGEVAGRGGEGTLGQRLMGEGGREGLEKTPCHCPIGLSPPLLLQAPEGHFPVNVCSDVGRRSPLGQGRALGESGEASLTVPHVLLAERLGGCQPGAGARPRDEGESRAGERATGGEAAGGLYGRVEAKVGGVGRKAAQGAGGDTALPILTGGEGAQGLGSGDGSGAGGEGGQAAEAAGAPGSPWAAEGWEDARGLAGAAGPGGYEEVPGEHMGSLASLCNARSLFTIS